VLTLSDFQLAIIRELAEPLPRRRRGEFLERVAAQVRNRVGDGELYRIAITVQRAMLGPNPTPEDVDVVTGEI